MAMNSSSRGGIRPIWIVIHTAEGSRTAASLFNYFNSGVAASSHAGADGYILSDPWVDDTRAAWTLLNGNPYSFNLELCGFAGWSRATWLSEGWVWNPARTAQVWNPRQMIRHAAQWVVQKRDAAKRIYGIDIPIGRKLTPTEVGRYTPGVCGHVDYTYGTGDGDHTDPGPNFPWDVLFNDINAILGGGSGGGGNEVPTQDEWNNLSAKVDRIHMAATAEISSIWGYVEAIGKGRESVEHGVNRGDVLGAWNRVWSEPLLGDPTRDPATGVETPYTDSAEVWLVDRARKDAELKKQIADLAAKVDQIISRLG